MEIRYFQKKEIDKSRWDAFIKDATNSLPYGYSWHLDVVCQWGWEAIVIGDWEAVLAIPLNKKIPFFKRSLQPLFSQQLGFFYKHNLPSEEIAKQVLSILRKRFWAINIHFNATNTFGFLAEHHGKSNYLLALNTPYADLYKAYNQGLRQRIKQAQRHELGASQFENTQMWATIFEEFQLPKFSNPPANLLDLARKTMAVWIKNGSGELWRVVDKDDSTLAVAFLLIQEHRVIYLFSATTDVGRKKAAVHFLIDFFIQKYALSEKIFDFEGSSIQGIAEFYASFGATPETYFVFNESSRLLDFLAKK